MVSAVEQLPPARIAREASDGFWPFYLRAILRPRATFEALLTHPRRLSYGGRAVALTAAVYFGVYFFLAHNGGRPALFKPWLAIPAEEYYRANVYFVVPSILLAWVAASGFTQLLARALGGKGSFEDTAAVLGFGLSISSWWTGLHDFVTTYLGFVGVIDQRAYEDAMNTPTPFRTLLWTLMTGYLVWFVLTFTKGVGAVHRLSVGKAAFAGTVGFACYQLVFVIFNR